MSPRMDQAGADLDRELYATIKGYIGAFQVCVPPARSSVTPCFSVFKRKSRRELSAHVSLPPELDAADATRARHSCVRCRRLKRRCSRDLPECTNCVASEGVCVYRARASRGLLVSRVSREALGTAAPGADSPRKIPEARASEAANTAVVAHAAAAPAIVAHAAAAPAIVAHAAAAHAAAAPAAAAPAAAAPAAAAPAPPTLPSIAYILGIPSLHNT
jgi:hypothetical protein